jgi:hypothetical protein
MRSLIGRLIIALAFVAAAFWARTEAAKLRDHAQLLERLATLRIDIDDGVLGTDLARANYWRGAYDSFSRTSEQLERAQDPQLLLIAANAAYRAAERTPQPRPQRIQQLDLVVQSYASALKSPVFMPDAAYNYEFVVRLRDAAARARGAPAPPAKAVLPTASADLPVGPTIHGRPGAPPPETKGEEFEILTPMEYGDREANPEPTTGVKPLRKG